jgi:hypothetical protein
MIEMPRDLRVKLLNRGHARIEVGNIRFNLDNAKLTRTISLDGKLITVAEFPNAEIDWEIVAKALEMELS